MVHRLTVLVILGTCSLNAWAWKDRVSPIELDVIREQAQMDIMREPATTNIEPDLAIARIMLRAKPAPRSGASMITLPDVQVFAPHGVIKAKDLLALLVKSLNLTVHGDTNIRMAQEIIVPNGFMSIERALSLIESHSSVHFVLYPAARRLEIRRSG